MLNGALAAYRIADDLDPLYSIVICEDDEEAKTKNFNILYKGTLTLARTLHVPTLVEVLLSEIDSLTFPKRNDAVYVAAVPVWSNGSAALIPGMMGPYLSEQGRRARRAGMSLPVETAVAIDQETGDVVPARRALRISQGFLEEIQAAFPSRRSGDLRAVSDRMRVDAVCTTVGGGPMMLQPMTRGAALHRLAGTVVNLEQVGGAALEGLGRLVGRARCYGLAATSPQQVLEGLAMALR
jgi:hypothetical protein